MTKLATSRSGTAGQENARFPSHPWRADDRRAAPSRRVTVAAAAAALLVALIGALPAAAAIAEVQGGTYVLKTAVTVVTPTLSSASTAHNLLIAVIDTSGNTTVTAPSGWVKAKSLYAAGVGSTQIWYYPNNPGGITSVAFTLSASDTVLAQLSEWSGVALQAPFDGSGSGSASSVTSLAVTATAAAANELAITSFTTSNASAFTPGTGWTNFLPAQSVTNTGDYKSAAGAGSVSETETSPSSTSWAGAIATFYGSCGGGSLSLTAPTTAAFGSLTLNGTNQTLTTSLALTFTDGTGSGVGWNITGTSTTVKNASNKTLPTTATTITAGSVAATAGTCRLPTNAIGYPVTLPAAAVAPAAVKLYNAAAATGLGPSTVTLTFQLSVPANTYNGTYSSTWTLAAVSGP